MLYVKNKNTTDYIYNRALKDYSKASTFDDRYRIIRRLKMMSTGNRKLMILANQLVLQSENN